MNDAQDCPPFSGLSDYVQLIGGATLTAVTALQNDISNIAICWDGGRFLSDISSFAVVSFQNDKSDTTRKNHVHPASVTLQIVFWQS